jgi:hypothetical protein
MRAVNLSGDADQAGASFAGPGRVVRSAVRVGCDETATVKQGTIVPCFTVAVSSPICPDISRGAALDRSDRPPSDTQRRLEARAAAPCTGGVRATPSLPPDAA